MKLALKADGHRNQVPETARGQYRLGSFDAAQRVALCVLDPNRCGRQEAKGGTHVEASGDLRVAGNGRVR